MRSTSVGSSYSGLVHLATKVAAILLLMSHSSCVSSSSTGDWLSIDDGIFDASATGDLIFRDASWNQPQAELQCAFRVLNALTVLCSPALASKMTTDGAARPLLFPPPSDDRSHCGAPLALIARLCGSTSSTSASASSDARRQPTTDFVAARGRRKNTNNGSDLPPGFLASRGRRSDPSLQRALRETHERQRRDESVEDVADLYLRGYYGSRG